MTASRMNALDQALDIAGSLIQYSNLTLADEPNGLGAALVGKNGLSAFVFAKVGSNATITNLTGFTAGDVGNFITFSNATDPDGYNNGTFLVVTYNSATSVDVLNPNAVSPDPNDGYIHWVERAPYSLLDDLNYARTDRTAIKGVAYSAAIPTYTRPTDTGTPVPTNLNNIATKTTDARGFILTRAFYDGYVSDGNALITLSATGLLKHSGSTDYTGIPVFDATHYVGDWKSCFVDINDGYFGTEMVVQSGIHAGERIFGISQAGSSISPDSVEVKFYSCPIGSDIVTSSTAYTWEVEQPNKISLFYGYFDRLDLLPDDAFRSMISLGLQSDGYLLQNIDDLLKTIGTVHGNTSLAGKLTYISAYYPFFDLPDATPSVVEALNTLNEQIGNRTYSGSIILSGETIAASLQKLSSAISGSHITRVIERLANDVAANTVHPLPSGSYVPDGTGHGKGLFVYSRGLLRDPGLVSGGNDYSETSSTSVTFYSKLSKNDHINYFIVS